METLKACEVNVGMLGATSFAQKERNSRAVLCDLRALCGEIGRLR